MRKHPSGIMIAMTMAGLAGCAVPDLGPPPTVRVASSATLAGPAGQWPATDWWQSFGDPQLSALIAAALRDSPDVAAAAARVRSADALVQQAGGALAPTITADGSVGVAKQSQNLGPPPQFVPDGILSTGRLTASFAFNLDLWGRNRAALRAARGDAAAAQVDAAQAALILSTEVATAYADLGRLYADRDVAEATLTNRQSTAQIVRTRVTRGLDNRGAQAQSDARVPVARADLAQIDESIGLTRHRLAALAGQGPDYGATLARPVLKTPDGGIPADAGINLVGRRPDLVAARLRAEAAGERIHVARTDFYPNISLGAVIGLQSLGLDTLFNGTSSYGNAGPAFSLPIFDGGRIAGRYRGARADYDGAVARYDQALLTALRDTADVLTSQAAIDARLVQLRAAVVSNQDAARVARLRYTAGLSNQLPLLQAEDALLSAQHGVTMLEARKLALSIALVRALGGGYTAPTPNSGAR